MPGTAMVGGRGPSGIRGLHLEPPKPWHPPSWHELFQFCGCGDFKVANILFSIATSLLLLQLLQELQDTASGLPMPKCLTDTPLLTHFAFIFLDLRNDFFKALVKEAKSMKNLKMAQLNALKINKFTFTMLSVLSYCLGFIFSPIQPFSAMIICCSPLFKSAPPQLFL